MAEKRKWKRRTNPKGKETSPVSSRCATCAIAKRVGGCYRVAPYLNRGSKYLIIGEAPGASEVEKGIPFIGPSGQLLDEGLHQVGISRTNCTIVNTCLCPPRLAPGELIDNPTYDEARHCIVHALALVQNLRPQVVISVGGPACKALFGTKQYSVSKNNGTWSKLKIDDEMLYFVFRSWFRQKKVLEKVERIPGGKETYLSEYEDPEKRAEQIEAAKRELGYDTEWLDTPVMPVFHPAYILRVGRQSQAWEDFCMGLQKARAKVDGIQEVEVKKRYRWIEGIDQWEEYVNETISLHESGNLEVLAADTETTMQMSIPGHLPYSPDTRIVCFSFSREPGEGVAVKVHSNHGGLHDSVTFEMFLHHLERLLTTVPTVWQNAVFDYNVIRCLLGIEAKVYDDTMLMEHWLAMGMGRAYGLDEIGQRYLGTGRHKTAAKRWHKENPGKGFEEMPEDILLDYAVGDTDVTLQAYWIIRKELEEEGRWSQYREHYWGIHKCWEVIADLEWCGMKVDREEIDRLSDAYPKLLQETLDFLHDNAIVRRMLYAKYRIYKEEVDALNLEISAEREAGKKRRRVRDVKTFEEWLSVPKNRFNPGSDKQFPELMRMQKLPFDHPALKDIEFSDEICGRCRKKYYYCRCEEKHKPQNIRATEGNRKVLSKSLRHWAVMAEKAGKERASETWSIIADAVDLVSKYKKVQKLNSTYVQGIYKYIPDQGDSPPKERCHPSYAPHCKFPDPWFLHPSYKMHGTATGRLSSGDPNGQNFPGKGASKELNIKSPYVSRWVNKGGLLVQPDYSQIEVRVMVVECGDERLAKAINDGKDIHRFVASIVHGIPEEEVTADIRKPVKSITFGIIYGQGIPALAQSLHITKQEAEELQNRFFAMMPKVKEYMEMRHLEVVENKSVSTRFGRVRHIDQIDSPSEREEMEALRQSVNTPIQSIASDICWRSFGRCWQIMKNTPRLEAYPFGLIHDSQTFDVAPGRFMDVIEMQYYEMVWRTMGLFPWLTVKPEADFSVGVNWAGLIDVGLVWDEDGELDHNRLILEGDPESVEDVHKAVAYTTDVEVLKDCPHPQKEEAEKGKWHRDIRFDRPDPIFLMEGKKLKVVE